MELDRELVNDYRNIVAGIRDFIELLKDEEVNPFIPVHHEELTDYLNIDSEVDRMVYMLESNLIKLETCKEKLPKNQIRIECNNLIKMNEVLIVKLKNAPRSL